MSKRLKIAFFICTVLCYIFTLIAYFQLDFRFFLAASILQAVFLLLFSFLSLRPDSSRDETESRITSIKKEWNFETQELKKQLSTKEEALTSLREEVSSAEKKNAELTARIKELEELSAISPGKPELFSENTGVEADMSVLPQFLPKPSESGLVNIVDIARSVAQEFHEIALKAGVTIQISASDENLLLKSDSNMIRILFRNIVDNSVKYMLEHGSLIITISSVGDDIFIVCKDTGKGLLPAETTHIFELNYQGSNRISGNGLGLYQAQAIVTFYGGTIFAKSNLDQGMGIYIQLPAR